MSKNTIYAMAVSVTNEDYLSEYHQCYVGHDLADAIGSAELYAHATGNGQSENDPYYFRALLTKWEDGLTDFAIGSISTETWRLAFEDLKPGQRPVL